MKEINEGTAGRKVEKVEESWRGGGDVKCVSVRKWKRNGGEVERR